MNSVFLHKKLEVSWTIVGGILDLEDPEIVCTNVLYTLSII